MTKGDDDRTAFRLLLRLSTKSPQTMPREKPLIDRLVRRGLVARDAVAGIVLTGTGAALVRRRLADSEGFLRQHQERAEIVIDDGQMGRRRVTVNQDESPLARLRRQCGRDGRPLLDAAEFEAGERLRSDYTKGQIMPRVTANWSASIASRRRDGGAGGMAELTDTAIAARQRVDRALQAVGPEFAGVLVDFCCFLKGIEAIERMRAWPARSAKLVLRLALSSLARHYGLNESARGGRSRRVLRHWGADDYRPTVD